MKNRFLSREEWHIGGDVALSREESHHLAKVLRLVSGEEVELTNGRGDIGLAEIIYSSPKESRVRVKTISTESFRSDVTIAF